jgi:glycosyltransferase involved in cell wall biosynthesis/tetratricopeptide (TPR) repeat protein
LARHPPIPQQNFDVKTLIVFATRWGSKYGGINSFNADLLGAIAAAYQSVKVICIVLHAEEEDIKKAESEHVLLISIGLPNQVAFTKELEPLAYAKLQSGAHVPDEVNDIVWLGHDRMTGEAALSSAKERGGRSALIHHMSYIHYEGRAENSEQAERKRRDQENLFRESNVIFAVGPLLRDAVKDMVDEREVLMLIPGLSEIKAANPPNFFTAFLSGRISEDARKIKQAQLGVAAFAHAINRCTNDPQLTNGLDTNREPRILLRGVNMEAGVSQNPRDPEQDLKRLAETHAKCFVNVLALPFTTSRSDLFEELRKSSVALMPSWHEGYGLVAWEAIAAGTPLIVSKRSGVFRFLEEFEGGIYVSLVMSVTLLGTSEEPYYSNEDIEELAVKIVSVANDPKAAREKAARLREALTTKFTWKYCAETLVDGLGWPDENVESPSVIISVGDQRVEYAAAADDECPLELPSSTWTPDVGHSESTLLRAEQSVIPFDSNQEPFLVQQLDWAVRSSYPFSVRLLTGQAGSGKTRLAIEMCLRLRTSGWLAGFVGTKTDEEKLFDWVESTTKPVFVVIDYADTRQETGLNLIERVCKLKRTAPIRLLLLARSATDWWEMLPGIRAACEAILYGHATSGPIEIPPLYTSIDQRYSAYKTACSSFAQILGLTEPENVPDLSEDYFSNPLYIQMVALAALRGERPRSAEGLARVLLNHEQRYWQHALASTGGVALTQAAKLLSLASITGALKNDAQLEIIWETAECGSSEDLQTLFKKLSMLYPDRAGLGGLKPDVLGEALFAKVLLRADGERFLNAILSEASPEFQSKTLIMLSRILLTRDDVEPVAENGIAHNFLQCIEALIAVCASTPGPLPGITEQAFERIDAVAQGQAADFLVYQFNRDIPSLSGLAVLVGQVIVKRSIERHKNHPDVEEVSGELASALHSLAVDYLRAGMSAEAESYAKDASEAYEDLAKSNPESYESEWVDSLDTYVGVLSSNAHNRKALEIAERVVLIRERLFEKNPELHKPRLATSLSNCAVLLSKAERVLNALESEKQALTMRRQLAKKDQEQFESDLALSLSNYASYLQESGDDDQALDSSRDALDIRKRLAIALPSVYEPAYASSLNNYAALLMNSGKPDEALTNAKEAIEIRRRLALLRPDRFNADYATSLDNYGLFLQDFDCDNEASEAILKALELRRRIASEHPDTYEVDLASSLDSYARQLRNEGLYSESIAYLNDAIECLRRCQGRALEVSSIEIELLRLDLQFVTWLSQSNNSNVMQYVKGPSTDQFADKRWAKAAFKRACLLAWCGENSFARAVNCGRALEIWRSMSSGWREQTKVEFILIASYLDHSGVLDEVDRLECARRLFNYSKRRNHKFPMWVTDLASRIGITLKRIP